MLIDTFRSVGRFVKITEARSHDISFLKRLHFISYSLLVFDKAYNYYYQFTIWTKNDFFYKNRLKNNAVYYVHQIKRNHYRRIVISMVFRVEIIDIQ